MNLIVNFIKGKILIDFANRSKIKELLFFQQLLIFKFIMCPDNIRGLICNFIAIVTNYHYMHITIIFGIKQ